MAKGFTPEMKAHFESVEDKYRLPRGYLTNMANIESRFGTVPDRPGSQYRGMFQMGNKERAATGVRDYSDWRQSAEGAAKLAVQNQNHLQRTLGRAPTGSELYLAHQQGAGGAAKLLANPNTPAGQLTNPKFISANIGNPNAPARDFVKLFAGKYDRGPAGPGTAYSQTQVASNRPQTSAPPQQQARLADSPAFKQMQPATVSAKPATQQQIAQPNIQPPVKQSILDKLNPIQPAYAGNQPRSDTLSRINPKDPSGPLLPAPVNGAAATPEQIARPNMSPFDRMRQMHYDSALNREAMDNPRFEKLGMAQTQEGVPQFTRPMDSQFRPSNLGLSNDRMMLPETPYAVNMAGSQEALQYAPPPDPTLQPVQMSQEHMAPFEPNMPTQQVTPLTEVNLPATDMPTVTPETYADPGPTFQMPEQPQIEMPSVGADMGGMGGEGMDMSGLMDAFSNLGGGGGGEGGGGGQPQPSGGGANAIADNFSIPDFPSATLGIGQQIAAQGQLANQPVPVQLGGQNMFNVKPIGMAGQQQMQDMSQAPLATKRLFEK